MNKRDLERLLEHLEDRQPSLLTRTLGRMGPIGRLIQGFLGGRLTNAQKETVLRELRKASPKQKRELVNASRERSKPGQVHEGEIERKPPIGRRSAPGIQMIRVLSSNVYSIGYNATTQVLAVRYKAPTIANNGKISGRTDSPGPIYHYFGVEDELWRSFMTAPSKGQWIWDNLRERGTIHGHQFDYKLVGATASREGVRKTYVPRKATPRGLKERSLIQPRSKRKVRSMLRGTR